MSGLILLGALVAAAIPPAYLLYYILLVLPQRRGLIERQLTEAAARGYVDLFSPAPHVEGTPAKPLALAPFDICHSPERYLITGLTAWIPMVVGIAVTALWIRAQATGADGGIGGLPSTYVMAFIGGYTWALYELISRARNGDLTPSVLIGVSFRMLSCVPIGYAFSILVTDEVAPFVAFAASAFPVRDVRLFIRRRLLRQIDTQAATAAAAGTREALLRATVQGVSADTLARLREINITTIVDLAYADPIRILIETGIPLRPIIDWTDQCVLALYVGSKLDALAPMGIRGALEAAQFFEGQCLTRAEPQKVKANAAQDAKVKEIAQVLGTTPASTVRMLEQVAGDPHVIVLSLLWGETSEEA